MLSKNQVGKSLPDAARDLGKDIHFPRRICHGEHLRGRSTWDSYGGQLLRLTRRLADGLFVRSPLLFVISNLNEVAIRKTFQTKNLTRTLKVSRNGLSWSQSIHEDVGEPYHDTWAWDDRQTPSSFLVIEMLITFKKNFLIFYRRN